MVENLLSKMYIEGALMSKSRNIALTSALSLIKILQQMLQHLKDSLSIDFIIWIWHLQSIISEIDNTKKNDEK